MSRNSNFWHDYAIVHNPLSVIARVSHKLRYLKLELKTCTTLKIWARAYNTLNFLSDA